MARKGKALAARFKAAFEAKRREEEERSRSQDDELARKARSELFADLLDFAQATGFLQAKPAEDGVELSFEGRQLRFLAQGQADGVEVQWQGRPPGSEASLYREPLLGHRWIWRYRRGGREHRVPLFDQGLEVLLIEALELPEPEDD